MGSFEHLNFKRLLRLAVALNIGLASFEQAHAQSTQIAAPAPSDVIIIETQPAFAEASPAVDVVISVVPAEQEAAVLKEVIAHSSTTLTVIDNGESDPIRKTVAAAQKSSPGADVQFVHIPTQTLKGEVEKIATSEESHHAIEKIDFSRRAVVNGLLVTIWSAGMFSAPFYIKSDVELATKIFATGFLIAGFQGMLTPYWQKMLRKGGQWGVKAGNFIAKVLGSTLKNDKIPEKLGSWAAAFGFNLAVATTVLGLRGALGDAHYVLMMALIGTWDVIWDLSIDTMVRLGILKPRALSTFVKFRVSIAPAVEGMAYAGGPLAVPAAVVMGVVGGSGLISFLTAEQIRKVVAMRTCDQLLAPTNSETQEAPFKGFRAIPDDIQ